MTKALLRIFGLLSIGYGAINIAAGINGRIGLFADLYINMGAAFVAAGVLLLGIARLVDLLESINESAISYRRPMNPEDPRFGNHSLAGAAAQKEYLGYAYAVHGDEAVVATVADRPMTWRNESEFRKWVDLQPPR